MLLHLIHVSFDILQVTLLLVHDRALVFINLGRVGDLGRIVIKNTVGALDFLSEQVDLAVELV